MTVNRWFPQGTMWQSFTTDEIAALVRDGRMSPNTLVRQTSSEDWRTVREVLAGIVEPPEPEAVFQPTALPAHNSLAASGDDSEDASHSAAKVLQEMAARHATAKPSGNHPSQTVTTSMHWGARILLRLWNAPWIAIDWIVDLLFRGIACINRKTVLAARFLLSLAFFIWASGMLDFGVQDLPDQIHEIWRSAVELADRQSTAAEWNTFSQESLTRLSAISKELESEQQAPGLLAAFKTENDSKWAQWELIQASKFDIPLAIKAGPEKLSEFSPNVENRLLRYEEFSARSSQPRVHNESTFEKDPTLQGSGATFDPTNSIIIGGDVLLVLGGIGWWLSRRRSG